LDHAIIKLFHYNTKEENDCAFYKHHLGRLGLPRIVQILKPEICILSEFGEEFRHKRLELAEICNDLFKSTKFFASDIKFAINSKKEIKAITDLTDIGNRKFIPYKEVLTCESQVDYSLHYYQNVLDKGKITEALAAQHLAVVVKNMVSFNSNCGI
jgi:hypothetical protein